jgi:hypothetical protein
MFLGTCIYQETFPFEKQKKLFCSNGAHNKRKFNKASISCYTMLLRARSKWAGSYRMGLYAEKRARLTCKALYLLQRRTLAEI